MELQTEKFWLGEFNIKVNTPKFSRFCGYVLSNMGLDVLDRKPRALFRMDQKRKLSEVVQDTSGGWLEGSCVFPPRLKINRCLEIWILI